MAQQQNIFRFRGKLGDLVGFKRGKKYGVREHVKEIQQSAGTKKVSRSFGEASKWGAAMRHVYPDFFKRHASRDFYYQCNSALARVVYTAKPDGEGNRWTRDANLYLLRGFEANSKKRLDSLQTIDAEVNPSTSLRVTNDKVEDKVEVKGEMKLAVSIPNLASCFHAPKQADAFCMEFLVINFCLESDDYEVVAVSPLSFPLDRPSLNAGLSVPLNLEGLRWLMVWQGIGFMEKGNRLGAAETYGAKVIYAAPFRDGVPVLFEAPIPAPVEAPPKIIFNEGWEIE